MRTLLLVCAFASVAPLQAANNRAAEWKIIDDDVTQLVRKSELEHLGPLLKSALADQSYPEAIKALALKLTIEAQIEGDDDARIARLQSQLPTLPRAMQPVLQAILAEWYWRYFQQHRWEFARRTTTAAEPGSDFRTWDLPRLLAEIERHFAAALANEKKLKRTNIAEYDILLMRGSAPDGVRPTLYDFIANQALQFYASGPQAGTIAEDEVELSPDTPVFGSAVDFLRWQPGADAGSPAVCQAIRLAQALLRFHASDPDPLAFDDADLNRLRLGYNLAVGDDKEARYKAGLQAFIERTNSRPISALATAELAELAEQDGEPAQAHQLALSAAKAFPGSAGATQCGNILRRCEQKQLQLQTERVWNAPWPTLNVTYRNLTHVYFRALPVDFNELMRRWSSNDSDDTNLNAPPSDRPPAQVWDCALPATADFKARTERLPVPRSLPKGFYRLEASGDPGFHDKDNALAAAAVWVSDLALVLRMGSPTANDGLVVNAVTGDPVAGAAIQTWRKGQDSPQLNPGRTNAEGRFDLPSSAPWLIAADDGREMISALRRTDWWEHRSTGPMDRLVFFADRAIYRPGQAIRYKGIAFRSDPESRVRTGESLTILFLDANGKEIARQEVRTNDYGSFSGTFFAPRNRLAGRMRLQAEGEGGDGDVSVQVEEYKRPRFQVAMSQPALGARLGKPVEIAGRATAYTGAPLDQARVRWSVTRVTWVPGWWGWQPPIPQKAIAHGTAMTGADGVFHIRFTAEPDPGVPADREPRFTFRIDAEVLDSTGETHSTERFLQAGYSALAATLAAEEWQTATTPVAFTVHTASLDGEAEPAEGTFTIRRLEAPVRMDRPQEQQAIWWGGWSAPTVPENSAGLAEWQNGPEILTRRLATDTKGAAQLDATLPAGAYRAIFETRDRDGKKVTAQRVVEVIDPATRRFSLRVPNFVGAQKWKIEPGETFTAVWGTGYESGRALVEIECDGRQLQRYWTAPGVTQEVIRQKVTEDMRGGFSLRVTSVRENRLYVVARTVDVPWTNKELSIRWQRFRSRLRPGERETWTAIVSGPDGKPAPAELGATLYDASLDSFAPLSWQDGFDSFRREISSVGSEFSNQEIEFSRLASWPLPLEAPVDWSYRQFPAAIQVPAIQTSLEDSAGVIELSPFVVEGVGGTSQGYRARATLAGSRAQGVTALELPLVEAVTKASGINLDAVNARKELGETAFFYPQLKAGPDGVVKIAFTAPESLTEWKFLAFAHDRDLRAGLLTDRAVTAKELMVVPNAPRFVRAGDSLEFTVKVVNASDAPQTGRVRLTFGDANSGKPVDAALRNVEPERAFDVPARQSRSYSWRIEVPDGTGFLTYRAVAATEKLSDGEEGYLPVLERKVLLTESLPLSIRDAGQKSLAFEKLLASGSSNSIRPVALTVQMTSHPAWFGVLALPYLMEYPYECSEQVFNRYYANALAQHIARSNPKIRRVFEQWRNTPALDSPLEKNADLKSVALEEAPWLRQAADESRARREVGTLFDSNRLDAELAETRQKLTDRQLGNGLWPWFPGEPASDYITNYIMTGFGRLRHLGLNIDVQPALTSLAALDAWAAERYGEILKAPHPEAYVPTPIDAQFLYGRSFFLQEKPVAAAHRPAIDFFLKQARVTWTKIALVQTQAQLALALQRFGDRKTPAQIVRSLKERSVNDPELGRYWAQAPSWWWYEAPIETEAMMIEALDEVAHDAAAVEDCRAWLLKQKQTQHWATTKGTADAVYALLLRGQDLLSSDALVKVALGGKPVEPAQAEAGTGFYEEKFVGAAVKPSMGHIVVTKTDAGVSWGSVHWQYLENIERVTRSAASPLTVTKTLWRKETTARGPVLQPVRGQVEVGDEIVVRIELRADRDMEFIHLKDGRASGTEPLDVLSGYHFQSGLGYYETTRDTATHFFFDEVRAGTYVFEYSTRAQLKGHFETGVAEVQCMYAPEFNSHSEDLPLVVR